MVTHSAALAGTASSVLELLELQASRRPDAPFLTDAHGTTTYGEAHERAMNLAAGFSTLGIARDDLVAVFMRNSTDYVLTTFALAHLGAAAVLINTEYKGELLRYVLDDSAARYAIVDHELVDQIRQIELGDLPLETLVVHGADHLAPHPGITQVAWSDDEQPTHALPAAVTTLASDLYMVIYTSGTTGPSKGVMISNGHCLAFSSDWVRAMELTGDDVLYSPLPLFHGIAYMLGVIATLTVGARMHLRRRFSISAFWGDVRATEATVAHLIFSIVPMLLSRPPSDDDRAHALRAVYLGPSKLSDDFEARFGVPVVEVYGQTETGMVTFGPIGGLPPGSCGRVNEERFEVRIVDEHDHDVALGTPGEIIVRPRSPHTTMLGYLNKPEATVETFRNLWHHSGDRATVDADGWVYFVDRAKDCIRRRGENISSYEIELILSRHPLVSELAAFPVPSELEEEEVKVCVVPVAGATLTPAEVHAFCVSHMPKFMVPRFVEVRDALPKTPSQKVEKYRLRAEGASGLTAATWDAERVA